MDLLGERRLDLPAPGMCDIYILTPVCFIVHVHICVGFGCLQHMHLVYTVFLRSDAVAAISFCCSLLFGHYSKVATIRGQRLFLWEGCRHQ